LDFLDFFLKFFWIFCDFLDFLGFFYFWNFFIFFWIFCDFLDFFTFLDFWNFLDFFGFFLDFFLYFWFLSKLLGLLLNVTMVTSEHQIAKNGPKQHKKLFFCPKGKKSLGRSPPQELEVGPRSRPYLLVFLNIWNSIILWMVLYALCHKKTENIYKKKLNFTFYPRYGGADKL
jgi:hypothetical protein